MRLLLIVAVFAGCGSNPSTCKDHICLGPDAPMAPPCDPVAQTNCAQGSRCTWIHDLSNQQGHIGCAPLASGLVGEPCQYLPVEQGGDDDCGPGLICAGTEMRCAKICDPASPACPSAQKCTTMSNLFVRDGSIIAGFCE